MTLFKQGNRAGPRKLTATDVLNMRADYQTGRYSQGDLSRKYSVSVIQVGRIVRREVWQDLIEPEMNESEIQASARRMLELQEGIAARKRMADAIDQEKANDRKGDDLLGELKGETGGK